MTQTLTKPDGTLIPAKYAKFNVVRQWDPTDPQRLRIFLCGFPGEGKTNFVMSNPHAWVLDPEDSSRDVKNPKAARIYLPGGMSDYLALIDMLEEDGLKGNPPCKHLVFDTMDKFMDHVILYLTEQYNKTHDKPLASITEYGQSGAGWFRIRDFIIKFLSRLYAAGYGWTAVGHLMEVKDPDTKKLRSKAVLAPSLMSAMYREAQFLMHVIRTTESQPVVVGQDPIKTAGGRILKKDRIEIKTTQKVRLQLANLPTSDKIERETKARYFESLPRDILLPLGGGWDAFEQAYSKATASQSTQIE